MPWQVADSEFNKSKEMVFEETVHPFNEDRPERTAKRYLKSNAAIQPTGSTMATDDLIIVSGLSEYQSIHQSVLCAAVDQENWIIQYHEWFKIWSLTDEELNQRPRGNLSERYCLNGATGRWTFWGFAETFSSSKSTNLMDSCTVLNFIQQRFITDGWSHSITDRTQMRLFVMPDYIIQNGSLLAQGEKQWRTSDQRINNSPTL